MLRDLDGGWNELGEGGWSSVEVGARFSNTHNKRKTKILLFKIIFFGTLKNLTKYEYFPHLLCEGDEVMSK